MRLGDKTMPVLAQFEYQGTRRTLFSDVVVQYVYHITSFNRIVTYHDWHMVDCFVGY